ncbi:MAG: LysR family transcriptional regulator [Gammaproteobacteria bacterium]
MDKFAEIETFAAVVETGTFSAAGERLGIAKSVVSRRIQQLEQRLNSRLLNRTTRTIALTDSGKNFYQRTTQILHDLDDAEQHVARETTELRGAIKLAAPLSFGLNQLSDVIADFLKQNPAIELNLDLNDRNINLIEEGIDMAVRIGKLQDSTLIARRIGTIHFVTCASEDYIKQYGEPRHLDEMPQHIGLQYSNISYKQQWLYISPEGKTVYAQPQLRIRTNNGEALAAAAAASLGIITGPTFILGKYIRDGRLKLILTDWQRPATGIYAVYPPGRLIPGRIQAFTEFLAGRLGDRHYWDDDATLTS